MRPLFIDPIREEDEVEADEGRYRSETRVAFSTTQLPYLQTAKVGTLTFLLRRNFQVHEKDNRCICLCLRD